MRERKASEGKSGKDFREIYMVFIVQAYQTSQYVVPRGGIFLGKWRSTFAGNSDGKINVQSDCALNTRYKKSRNRENILENGEEGLKQTE
jgi:hypothetical protein